MSPEQIEVERKAFDAWYEEAPCFGAAAAWDAWLARAEKAHRVREALEFYARSCDATETSPCGYEGNLCCKVARAALKD